MFLLDGHEEARAGTEYSHEQTNFPETPICFGEIHGNFCHIYARDT